jgi:hypothetical protein
VHRAGALATVLVMVTGHLSAEEAISTWPLAPRSGSLSGYREIHDRELAHAEAIRSREDLVHRAALRLSSMACLPPFW